MDVAYKTGVNYSFAGKKSAACIFVKVTQPTDICEIPLPVKRVLI